MIAADSSVMIAWLKGEGLDSARTEAFRRALQRRRLVLPPVVVTELFAAPLLPARQAELIRDLETLPLIDGYWERSGRLRAEVGRQGLKARLGDVLVAQACIDTDTPLIVRGHDFRHFIPLGLKLAVSV